MASLVIEPERPTNDAFTDALEFLASYVEGDLGPVRDLAITLVHGICLGPPNHLFRANEPYAHAWVEANDVCWQAGIFWDSIRLFYPTSREDFYEAWRPQETTHYTLKQAAEENENSGHFGPWLAQYRKLCLPGND